MYDKSRKTWSQRLKIHKSDASQLSNNAASVTSTASPPATASPGSASQIEAAVAHNVSLRSGVPANYQIAPAAVMHLPAAMTSMSDYHAMGTGAGYDYMTGRSLKYAEPWIYGTVRGIPARPAGLYHNAYAAAYSGHPHAAAIFAAPTEMPTAATAVAVVLCSCPEYLSGTKGRTLKKASVCKKCKGTRLPLANIGGTVRVSGTMQPSNLRPVGASSTVRVVSSSKKQRPTILDPQKDPYDLMRRTRLLSPEPKASPSGGKDKTRGPGKNTSPVRGRPRSRHNSKGISLNSRTDKDKVMESVDDSWLTEGEDLAQAASSSHSRKSILRCNVNPYDLISLNSQNSPAPSGELYKASNASYSSTSSASSAKTGDQSKHSMRRQKLKFSQSEFMPPNDEFNVQDAAFPEDEHPFLQQSRRQGSDARKDPLAKNSEPSQSPSHTSAMQRKGKKPNYTNVQAIAGQRISLGAEQQSSKSLIQKGADGSSTYESIAVGSDMPTSNVLKEDFNAKATRPDTLKVNFQPQADVEAPKSNRNSKAPQQPEETKDVPDQEKVEKEILVTVTVKPTYNIKSILKRPPSKSSDAGRDSNSNASTPSTPKLRTIESKPNSLTDGGQAAGTAATPVSTSHFYIPLPQTRKKVQFLVEEDELNVRQPDGELELDCESDDSETSIAEELTANYQYYHSKRNQKKIQKEDVLEADADPLITYDEQFIQAMLLQKLQLDSELVTKKQQEQLLQNTTTLHINEDAKDENAISSDKSSHVPCHSSPSTSPALKSCASDAAATRITAPTDSHKEEVCTGEPIKTPPAATTYETQPTPVAASAHNVSDMSGKSDGDSDEAWKAKKINSETATTEHGADSLGGLECDAAAAATDDNCQVLGSDERHANSVTNTGPDSAKVSDSNGEQISGQYGAATLSTISSTTPATPPISAAVYADQVGDDDAATTSGPKCNEGGSQSRALQAPQQRQKVPQKCSKRRMKKDMQTSPAAPETTDSTAAEGQAALVDGGAQRKPTKETQSRNPIRRSQSERQPGSVAYQQDGKNLKFKSDASDELECGGQRSGRQDASKDLEGSLTGCGVTTNKTNGGPANNGELHFHDTMALRKRSNRNDTRDLFTIAGAGRPREPPPPPPAAASPSSREGVSTAPKTAVHFAPSIDDTANGADGSKTRQKATNGLNGQATSNASCPTVNGVHDGHNKPRRQQEESPRKVANIPVVNVPESSDGIVNAGPVAKRTTTNISTPSLKQRTVVRVPPFNKNANYEVHRLKITHTDSGNGGDRLPTPTTPKSPGTPDLAYSSHYSVTDLSTLNSSVDYGQQKTSILINGDDCYSTMNLGSDDSSTPHYHSSVVVTDGSFKDLDGLQMTNSCNTVTINVSSPRSSEDELIQQHNQLNDLLKRHVKTTSSGSSTRAIIPIRGTTDINLQRSASSTSSNSTSSMTSTGSSASSSTGCTTKRGKTLIRLDFDKERSEPAPPANPKNIDAASEWLPHETELLKILRNPVEAVKRNLVPHICKLREDDNQKDSKRSRKMKEGLKEMPTDIHETSETASPSISPPYPSSFISKLLEDPMLNQVAEGLEADTVAELIENSLKRLQQSRNSLDMSGTKDSDDVNRLIDLSLKRIQEERGVARALNSNSSHATANGSLLNMPTATKDEERLSNRGSISSANSFASAHNYEMFDFDATESDCYQSCSSEINSMLEDEVNSTAMKSKFYQMLVDATLQEIELSTSADDLNMDDHQYESIRHNIDPIYEEISDVPPPLPLTAPPLNDPELEKKSARSIFEGASKYDILSYLVDAKERGVVKEETFDYALNVSNPIIIEEESSDTLSDLGKLSKLKRLDTVSSRSSVLSDSSEDSPNPTISSLSPPSGNNFMLLRSKNAGSDIERNDSGVGSETSKTSRSKFLNPSHNSSITSSFSSTTSSHSPQPRSSPLHLCEDCDGAVETQVGEDGSVFAPLVCRKCGKKRVERKEIITEIVETEEKYGRDLQIILEEFCHPMLVAGLLTQEQLSAIFLNTEELLENNQTLAERMRDALDIALEQGDDDLLTVNIGKIFLESTQMLHAFESYCVRQAGASLLLANLEKEKELLRIFLKVSQMENAVLRRMNLNSFLMVPVQRVTKYPLLLARLYKVTPSHLEGRDLLKQAQEKIELHLNHINQEAKDVPTKLWRRISSSSPSRRASCEIDMINIKLRKMAIDVLEWNHDEVRFVMEGKLLYTQPTDSNWKKARTIKLSSVNALLVTNGKPSSNYKAEKVLSDKLSFPKHTGIREASLLVVKEKCGRYALIREPLYLDRCVVCSEADWEEYFEVQEISSKDTFIFKAEDNIRTKQWYTQLQYHAQGMGAWRKRRNALANIMINGMLTRS